MFVSVCLSVSISPEPHMRSLPFFVHVAYRHGSVVLQQGGEIPRGRGTFGGFLPHSQCIVQHAKTAEPIKMPFGMMTRVGPRYHVLDRETRSTKGKGPYSKALAIFAAAVVAAFAAKGIMADHEGTGLPRFI